MPFRPVHVHVHYTYMTESDKITKPLTYMYISIPTSPVNYVCHKYMYTFYGKCTHVHILVHVHVRYVTCGEAYLQLI